MAIRSHRTTPTPSRCIRCSRQAVAPLFYQRDAHGIPVRWLARVRASMRTLLPVFNTDRMVRQYAAQIYLADGDGGPP